MDDVTEKNDPFNDFESLAEVAAFVHKKNGEAGVRDFLKLMTRGPAPAKCVEERARITTAETLTHTADELASLGLSKLASIVREYVPGRPNEIDLSPYPPGTIDHRAWLAGMKRRRPAKRQA